MPKHSRSKEYHGDHHRGSRAPKPPSRFLWVMEAVLISLVIFSVFSVFIILWLAITNHKRAQDAVNLITGITPTQKAESEYKKVHSKLGFEMNINKNLLEAVGIKDGFSGQITAEQIYQPDYYSQVNVYYKSSSKQGLESTVGIDRTTYMTVQAITKNDFFTELRKIYGQGLGELDLLNKYFAPAPDPSKSYSLLSSEEITAGGNKYLKNTWEITNNQALRYKTRQTDYITVQDGRAYRASIYQNAGYDPKDYPAFIEVVESLKFYPTEQDKVTSEKNTRSLNLLPGDKAYAASRTISSDTAIQVVARNMPAVVRIGTVYCIDFNLTLGNISQPILGGCGGGTGSGFIVTPSGYVATNGHVVKFTPLDVLVDSIYLRNRSVTKSYLDFLVKTGQAKQATADSYYKASVGGDRKAQGEIVGSMALLPTETSTSVIKEDAAYAVQLSNKAIEFDYNNLKNINFSSTIVPAKLVDTDYDPYADITTDGFKSSDVAILKLGEANNYPFVSLGSIDGLTAGSPLVVIGFPGLAENDLVNTAESVPTSTEGKVSSIRTAKGTSNKLIQSDVTIAQGNSGGPAFNSLGDVVGIATYGYEDNGVKLNYMRDVADLKALLSKNKIALPESSIGAQKYWEDGLGRYSKAYYSSAIDLFKKSLSSYPQNRVAAEFIAKAESYKKDGKEAIPPEIYGAFIGGAVVLVFIPATIMFFVVRHHRKRKRTHEEYIRNNSMQMAPKLDQTKSSAAQQPKSSDKDMLRNAPGPQ